MPDESLFVNRDDELKQLNALITKLDHGGYLPKSVFNIYGAPGIGKSSLLAELKRQWSSGRYRLLFINLHDRGLPRETTQQKKFCCEQLVAQLATDAGNTPQIAQIDEQLQQAPEDERFDAIGAALVRLLEPYKANQIIILMVDACEQATDACFAWLERRILLPLIHEPEEQQTRLLCLLTSQLILRWRQHNVRRRVDLIALEPLSPEATHLQVNALLNGRAAGTHEQPSPESLSLGQHIYNLTFGHPLATKKAIERLVAEAGQPAEYGAWLSQNENQQSLSSRVVVEIQDHAIKSMAGKKLSSENWDILEALAILREFEVNVMRVVLPTYHEKYGEISQSMLLIYIRELLETRLAIWNSEVRAYQIAPAIRRIIARRLALHKPELYQNLRAKAQAYYAKQIETVMNNRHVYLLEYLFQRLSAAPPRTLAREQLSREFEKFLTKHYHLRDESLKQLNDALEQDKELQELLVQHDLAEDLFTSCVQTFYVAA